MYEILPCFLLPSTSFHFSLRICFVSWEKSSIRKNRSIFFQHDAPFLWLYYLCPSPIFLLASHRSCFHTLPMTLWGSFLIPGIHKLFLLDLSSRSTNFLRISNAHVGSVVCITRTFSFVELSSFSRLCTFSLKFENLWSISF